MFFVVVDVDVDIVVDVLCRVVGCCVCVAFIILANVFGLSFVSNLFAFVPIYESYKALRSPDVSEKTTDRQTHTYN
jgi:UPF0716 family protein affecting phage T7 exclusion